MAQTEIATIAQLLATHEREILAQWLAELRSTAQSGRISEAELETQCRNFLQLLRTTLAKGSAQVGHAGFAPVRDMLADISRARALQGFSPVETATFIFSLKRPVFAALNKETNLSPAAMAQALWAITVLLDDLGLHTMEAYQKAREEVISRQQMEITELSTPVIKLWEGILAVPLIGTLDSSRTQVVMEALLQAIVDQSAEIAIIDITGVPTVDTLTAQHLLKTVSAARLMGADCIISGIRPQIAQTIVHLGVQLDVISKASLADALVVALRRTGRAVVKLAKPDKNQNEKAGV